MVNDNYPHLSYFCKDAMGYHFKIRRDDQYWPAIVRLTRPRRTGLRYAHNAHHKFRLPPTAHAQLLLATIFPVEWEIIVDTDANELVFPS